MATSQLIKRYGHDFGPAKLDAAGIVWSCIAIIYSTVLAWGLVLLYRHRKHNSVRIRNVWVIFSAVLSIHVYLTLIYIAYPLNGLYACGFEFWIMSIVLPLGMGLFQGMPAIWNAGLTSH